MQQAGGAGVLPARCCRAVEAGGDGGEGGTRENDCRADGDLEEEDDGGEAGQRAADRRPVDDGEAGCGGECEALAGLEPRFGDRIEAGEEDASGEGGVEDDMRGDNAAEAEDGHAEPAEPAAATPDGEEAEGDDNAGRDDGRGEEADDQRAAGKAQAVEGPGEGDADEKREDGREARLQRGDVDEVADVGAGAGAGLAGGGGED